MVCVNNENCKNDGIRWLLADHCEYCGAKIGDSDKICPGCGAPRKEIRVVDSNSVNEHVNDPKEKVAISTIVLAFIFPPVALFTRHTWKKYMPKNYKAAKITACISVAMLFYIMWSAS